MRALPVLLAALLTLVGCAAGAQTPDRVTVFAAASLTETFTELEERFEAEHGIAVDFNFAGSSALAQQINNGAPADVFASASPVNMDQVAAEVVDPVVFATNRLQIVVPAGNPGGVTGLTDFADPDLVLAACQERVPCGRGASAVFAEAGVEPALDTLEPDVKAVLTKVRLGEVDAGLVYRTDVLAADGDEVVGVDFPEAGAALNDYPVAALSAAPNTDGAKLFVEFVLSRQDVFTDAGFGSP